MRGAGRLPRVRVGHHQEVVAVDLHVCPVVGTGGRQVLESFKALCARLHAVQHRVHAVVATLQQIHSDVSIQTTRFLALLDRERRAADACSWKLVCSDKLLVSRNDV